MKVLFVSSGNSKLGISPIIKNQAISLQELGIEIDYFAIQGKGFYGYIKNISKLRKYLRINSFGVVHAHYSLSAIIAALAGAKPLIVSLMGSDVKANKSIKIILWLFYKFYWSHIIVKSDDMKYSLGFKHVSVIPNGVDLEIFKPIDTTKFQHSLCWDAKLTHILFAANPDRYEKNFQLAKEAVELLKDKSIELHYLKDIPNSQMPIYLNAADVVVLSSLWEGSPNVIKEAMACSRPIVSTNVGDVEWLFGGINGHFLTGFDLNDFVLSLQNAIEFSTIHTSTKGRERILNLGLDSESVARSLINIYSKLSNGIIN